MKNVLAATIVAIVATLCAGPAQAVEINWPEPNWPEIFEPNQLLTLNLEMDPCDWQAVINNHPAEDGCLYEEVELPAWFWMEGEEHLQIRVAVRRKKSIAFPDETNTQKVALKIDINEYYCDPCSEDCSQNPLYDPNAAPDWHGLKKLSLEANSDAIDAIVEGVACNLHRIASATEGYGWPVWHANWAKVYVNGAYIGLYVNNEQYDKQYLKHRDYYVSHDSWLYKFMDCFTRFELKVGDDTYPKSPALDALCYSPFAHPDDPNLMPAGGICPVPDDANVFADMNKWINMERMLSSAAIDAIIANSDPLFWQSNNTYWMDWNLDDPCETRKRMYFPWDVDASFKSYDTTIYYEGSSSAYDDLILTNPVFRSQYNQITRDLLDGPLTFADINDFLEMVEPVITDAAEADPWLMWHINNRIGATTAAEVFDWLRSWFAARIPNVRDQVAWDEPQLPPGTVLLNDDFGGTTWDANWTHTGWAADTSVYAHSSPAAKAPALSGGDFICNALDTNDATAIHIEFWCRKDKDAENDDLLLYYYNKTTAGYDFIADLDSLGENQEWLFYTDTITDSNYFTPNFRIKFVGTPESKEEVWVDEVMITKEAPMAISGYIRDSGLSPITGVSVDADNGGGSDITDSNGCYELSVPFDWSGTVTPTKAGYTFEPNSRPYTNVTEDQAEQNYTATLLTYTISGTVTCGGSGLAGVVMNGLPSSPATDANGFYTDTVDYGWSNTVTPTKAGYTFTPANRVYNNVTSDQTAQDYAATLLTYTISGTVTCGGSGFAGVTMAGLPSSPATDANGFYTDTVDYGWSGTVIPTKEDYNFSPSQRIYSGVTSDQPAQDYVATSIYDLDANGSIDLADLKVMCGNWLGSGPGDFDNDGTVALDDFAEFGAAW